MGSLFRFTALAAALVGVFMPAVASAQANAEPNKILVVPYTVENPRLPHPAHEQAPVTLKAMVRNATCVAAYRVRWDTDLDGDFADEQEFSLSRNGTTKNLWDIGRTITIPNVDREKAVNYTVRLQVPCAAEGQPANHFKFGTMRFFVYDFAGGPPANMTDEQVEIMTIMAVQESMWWHHRLADQFGGDHTTSTLYGQYSARSREQWGASALAAWMMSVNGHHAAYPPGTINWYNMPRNAEWEALNEHRWNTDPYAETIMRFVNGVLRADSRAVSHGASARESTACGYDANRNAINCNRIDGGDRLSTFVGNADGGPHNNGATDPATYLMGVYTGATAVVTPALAGTPLQVGHANIVGKPYEWLIQGQVDMLGYQQMWGNGSGQGGWYYHRYTGTNGVYSDMSVTQWAMIGLEAAEQSGGFAGVFVPNNIKYRVARNSYYNIKDNTGAGRYRNTSSNDSLMLSGGAMLGLRWVGAHNMVSDAVQPHPGAHTLTRQNLVTEYQRVVSFTRQNFHHRTRRHGSRQDRFWASGDHRCGNNNDPYNVYRCGSTYTIYSHQKAYRTGEPELSLNDINWLREFSTYYTRAQDRVVTANNGRDGAYTNFGRLYDQFCAESSITCNCMSPSMMSGMGGLILTPTIFNPKPVAIGTVQPDQVVEGCVGGNAGEVVFDHGASFHPGSDNRIVAFQWDVDASNGLWWANNSPVDYESANAQPFEHRYETSGNYTATLRVIDDLGQSKTVTVQVTVNAADNVRPSVAHGGPYVIEVGSNLQLDGNATDQNLNCGDAIIVGWDLDAGGQFNDAVGPSANVAWAALAGLGQGAANPNIIRVRVVDSQGAEAIEQTTLTIYPREPVASGRANPNPSGCQQQVTFDGSASAHPNPQRTIAQYDWDIDGDGRTDGGGAIFRFAYGAFATYNVTLTVTDDLGRSDTDRFDVVVNQGNQAPVARVAHNEIVVLEDGNLVLDGRPSTDPDIGCGDSIVEYAWDLNGNGSFNDAVDVRGANPTVPWATVAATLQWPADRDTGLPANTVTLRITDEFGATSTANAVVRIYEANPVAMVVQVPDPGTINIVTGFSRVTLDGRQSFSTVPGVAIAQFDWDLNDDGVFERLDQPTADKIHVFDPVPLPPRAIPEVAVRLRVTDANGRTDIVRYVVHYDIPPTPPTADADPTDPPERGYDILVGEDLTLDASQSFDPDADEAGDYIQFYRWDLDFDANAGFAADVIRQDADGNAGAAAKQVTITWAELNAMGINGPGAWTVRLQVEDTTQLRNTDDAPLRVHAAAPVALADINPNPAACGGRVSFDGSASNHPHPTIDIAGYSWDFDGDGNADVQGAQVQHTFNAFTFGAPNNVILTVTDTRGETGQVAVPVPVTEGNRAPSGNAGGFRDGNGQVTGPYAIASGEGLSLSAAGSSDPDAACGDTIQSYQWDLRNDGTIDANGAAPNLTWAQLNAAGINGPGQYDVRLRVVDRFGITGDAIATLVVASAPVARAAVNPNRAGCEQQVEFNGEASSFDGPAAQGFAIVAYDWDLDGDGQFDDASGASVLRPVVALPNANGDIVVTANLRVTDASGRTSTNAVQVVINVQNQRPVANAGGPYTTGPVGNGFADVTLDGRGSLDPNAPCDQVVIYKWDTDNDGRFGADDQPDDLVGPTVVYNNNRWRVNTVQTVALVVCDVSGACSDPAEAGIEVQDEAPPAGEVVSPRADAADCLGQGNFNLDLRISDPTGDVVTAIVVVGGNVVGQDSVDTPNDGSQTDLRIAINSGLIAEGRHEIRVTFRDADGAESQATSGGRLTFDRTAPDVTIGNALGEGVCYNPNAVPDPAVNVVDALDAVPAVNQSVIEDGCGRTLRVVATDTCGNSRTVDRSYLTAQAVQVELQGVAEGELVADARITWNIVGPAACASDVTAAYSRNGGAAIGYPENTLLNQAGNYAFTASVANCLGVARQQILNFSVNAPPTAVPIPPGHPNADPNLPNAYIAIEGGGLQLDGSASTAPEPGDAIAQYAWDLDGNGTFETQGRIVAFDTSEDGIFNGALRVTDSLGASSTSLLRVTVMDVSPIADAAGPYVVSQGTPLAVDARGSQPGSAADLISNYIWDWGDGSPLEQGADFDQRQHTYQANGTYTIRLVVEDEDNFSFVDVRVTVRDVNPIIDGINVPADPYEIAPMHFSIDARPGTASDPITRYEWDMDGDGVAEYGGLGMTSVNHQFDEAGGYNVTVTVRDGDSASVEGVLVDVREVTLAEIIAWTNDKVTADLAGGQLPLLANFQLGGILEDLDRARWGEAHDERGVTFMALESTVRKLVAAQGQGADYGWELWALSRQLKREVDRLEQHRFDNDNNDPNDPAMLLARDHLEGVDAVYNDPDFVNDVNSNLNAMVASDLFIEARESYYWLEDASYQCNAYGDFALPDGDPIEVGAAGERINSNDLRPALLAMREELHAYVAKGLPADPGPGRDDINAILPVLDDVIDLQALPLGPICPENMRCISDREALELELIATEIVRDLEVAGNGGSWVRQWQSCLVLTLKFRIELSIQRVEFVCGANNAISRRARQVQDAGLNLVSQDRDADALSYYADIDQQCTMIEVHDQCLVPAFPDDHLPYDGNVVCPEPIE